MTRDQAERRMTQEALERHRRIEFEQIAAGRIERLESEVGRLEQLHRETRAALDAALRRLEAKNGSPHSPKITPNSASFPGKVQSRRGSEG